ncbi:MAG: hypothetical protein DRH08_00245 [Deltaproteobacteria bacterium]|nr:MAG: hypothetical protein DRH08_00245 [Deltaproteobacteria bacterium]
MALTCNLCGGFHYLDVCPYKGVLDTSDRVAPIDKLCSEFAAMELDIQFRSDEKAGEANRISKTKPLTSMGRKELLREIAHLRSYFKSPD